MRALRSLVQARRDLVHDRTRRELACRSFMTDPTAIGEAQLVGMKSQALHTRGGSAGTRPLKDTGLKVRTVDNSRDSLARAWR